VATKNLKSLISLRSLKFITLIQVSIFLFTLKNLGIISHDDADWFLYWNAGTWWEEINIFAKDQGRFFAYIFSPLSMFMSGNLDKYFVFIIKSIFIITFLYFFEKFLFETVGKFLSIFAVLNFTILTSILLEGSILTSYPSIFWVQGTLFFLSTNLVFKFISSGNKNLLYSSIVLYFLSLFIHENISVLFTLTLIFYYFLVKKKVDKLMLPRFKLIFKLLTIVTIFYYVIFLTWRLSHPSIYTGNQLQFKNNFTAFSMLRDYVTQGTLLGSFIRPYAQKFYDPFNEENLLRSYAPTFDISSLSFLSIIQLLFLLTFFVVFYLLIKKNDNLGLEIKFKDGLILGLIWTFIPILPLIYSKKYQEDYSLSGVAHYGYSVVANLGLILLFSLLVLKVIYISQISMKLFVIIALFLLICSNITAKINGSLVTDISSESFRYVVIDRLISEDEFFHQNTSFYIPQFEIQSWQNSRDINHWNQLLELGSSTFTLAKSSSPLFIGQNNNTLILYSSKQQQIEFYSGVLSIANFQRNSENESVIYKMHKNDKYAKDLPPLVGCDVGWKDLRSSNPQLSWKVEYCPFANFDFKLNEIAFINLPNKI
jgi:hypothetical protein